jgi:hypothetical protein
LQLLRGYTREIRRGDVDDPANSRTSGRVPEIGTDRAPITEGTTMSDKSPRQTMSKKSGRSLKEKRADKQVKSDRRATVTDAKLRDEKH